MSFRLPSPRRLVLLKWLFSLFMRRNRHMPELAQVAVKARSYRVEVGWRPDFVVRALRDVGPVYVEENKPRCNNTRAAEADDKCVRDSSEIAKYSSVVWLCVCVSVSCFSGRLAATSYFVTAGTYILGFVLDFFASEPTIPLAERVATLRKTMARYVFISRHVACDVVYTHFTYFRKGIGKPSVSHTLIGAVGRLHCCASDICSGWQYSTAYGQC